MSAVSAVWPTTSADLPDTIDAVDRVLAVRVADLRQILIDAGCGLLDSPRLGVDLVTELECRLADPS